MVMILATMPQNQLIYLKRVGRHNKEGKTQNTVLRTTETMVHAPYHHFTPKKVELVIYW